MIHCYYFSIFHIFDESLSDNEPIIYYNLLQNLLQKHFINYIYDVNF